MKTFSTQRTGPLCGTLEVPADARLSLAALLSSAMARGASSLRYLAFTPLLDHAIEILRLLGTNITRDQNILFIEGTGGSLKEPSTIIDLGSHTDLLTPFLGLTTGLPHSFFFTADTTPPHLQDILIPLTHVGATIMARQNGQLPLGLHGAPTPTPLLCRDVIAKEALLLATLRADGVTTILQKNRSPAPFETALRLFGADVTEETTADGRFAVSLAAPALLTGRHVALAGSTPLAAPLLAAALLKPGSAITLRHLHIDASAEAFFAVLTRMNATSALTNHHDENGFLTADIMAQGSVLTAAMTSPAEAELLAPFAPSLLMLGVTAKGESRFANLAAALPAERLRLLMSAFEKCGAQVRREENDIVCLGEGLPPKGGAELETKGDALLAISFACLGTAAFDRLLIEETSLNSAAFSSFAQDLTRLLSPLSPI